MPIRIAREDYDLLVEISRLADEGHTIQEIARAVGYARGPAIRYRLGRLGFRIRPSARLETALTGERFSDLVAAGEIVPEDDGEEAREAA